VQYRDESYITEMTALGRYRRASEMECEVNGMIWQLLEQGKEMTTVETDPTAISYTHRAT